MTESKKTPITISPMERLRQKARELQGWLAPSDNYRFEEAGSAQGIEQIGWAAGLGDSFAKNYEARSLPSDSALFFNKARSLYEAMPLMVKMWADGLSGPSASKDRLRLAMCSAPVSDGECEEMLAAIESKRIIESRGFPQYWSPIEIQRAKSGLEAFVDRTLAENFAKTASEKREAFSKMGKAIGCLGSNCDLLALFADEELKREGANLDELSKISSAQAELVGCARDSLALPSLQRTVANCGIATGAGVALATGAALASPILLPWASALALAVPALKGVSAAIGGWKISTGFGVACSAMVSTASDFAGYSLKSPSRLDAFDDFRQGGGSGDQKSSAKAADERLIRAYSRLSESMLGPMGCKNYIKALGYTRNRLMGGILLVNRVDAPELPNGAADRIAALPRSELALLGQFSEPALSSAFLLEAKSRTERLDIVMLQKRLEFLGTSAHAFDLGPKQMDRVHALLLRGNDAFDYLDGGPDSVRRELRVRLDKLTPAARRLASLCPKAEQIEFMAGLLSKPIDDARQEMDVASRLNNTLSASCARLEREGFLVRQLASVVKKLTRSLIDSPMRALRSLADILSSTEKTQSYDYKQGNELLAKCSGGIELHVEREADRRMELATSVYAAIEMSKYREGCGSALSIVAEKVKSRNSQYNTKRSTKHDNTF